MFSSDRFLTRIRKYRKTNRTEPPETQIMMIRAAFLEMTQHLPDGLVSDVFERFEPALRDGPEDCAFDRCERLGDVLDLLHQEYDVRNDPLSTADWVALSAAVSDYALDLDMDFVSYVMSLAVDHHAL